MPDVDEDLHDVFRALYEGDEWEHWAGDDDDEVEEVAHRYSRAYLRAALSALITPVNPPSRKRIYPVATPPPGVIPSTSPLPPIGSDYAPFSPLPLLARLRTFSPATYSPTVPERLSPRALALHGWVNNAKDGLGCANAHGRLGCDVTWGVGGLADLAPPIRNEVVRRLSSTLSSRHGHGCGWRNLPSPPRLFVQLRQLTHPLVSSSLLPLARAIHVRSIGPTDPMWSSPLSASQIHNLSTALESIAETPLQLHPLAVALALFGWYPYDNDCSDHVQETTVPGSAPRTEILSCRLCNRRIGLWLFNSKDLQVDAQHLWWCPLAAGEWWRECPLLEPRRTEEVRSLGLPKPPKRRRIAATAAQTWPPTSAPTTLAV